MEVFVEVLWKEGSPMSEKTTQLNLGKSLRKHRVGRVTINLRGKIWYIYYCENEGRVRRQVGVSLAEAKRLAAQANAQLAEAESRRQKAEAESLAAAAEAKAREVEAKARVKKAGRKQ